jgi:peptide/nickel transport system substrate-binding protein
MKKFLIITLVVSISMVGLVLDSFGKEKPRYGGILRQISASGPRVMGYLPEMGPGDEIAVLPAVERMMEYNQPDKQIHPMLAESVDVDRDKNTITFNIRKGVKFHDGSDLTAEVAAWNYQLYKDTKRLQFDDKVKSIEVVDRYTMVLHLTDFNNQFIDGLGWVPIYSKAAWDKASGGDMEKGKEFARLNCVGTGPFKLAEYKRDDYIKWVKFDGYWQKGKPYLDGIITRIIPDPVTASAVMQAKEADMWYQPPIRNQAELEKKGLVRQSGFGLPRMIYIDNKDPDSRFRDKRLREAVEYALDKPAIAKALGFGYFTPLTMVAPPGEWGYDPDYPGRPYNPEKARKLLAEAGYPKGLKVTITAMSVPTWPDEAEAIARYLRDIGIEVNIDLADPGRFFNMLWLKGWDDTILFLTGLDFNYLATFFRQFGPNPFANYADFKRPPELFAMAEEAYQAYDDKTQKAWAEKLVRYMADEALVIPMYLSPSAYIIQPWVHTTYLQEMMVARQWYNEWMEEH